LPEHQLHVCDFNAMTSLLW